MSKKQVCLDHQTIAYYSGFGGFEIRHIEDDFIYAISGAWSSKKSYHKLLIYSDKNGDFYCKLHGYKIPFNECIRTNVF